MSRSCHLSVGKLLVDVELIPPHLSAEMTVGSTRGRGSSSFRWLSTAAIQGSSPLFNSRSTCASQVCVKWSRIELKIDHNVLGRAATLIATTRSRADSTSSKRLLSSIQLLSNAVGLASHGCRDLADLCVGRVRLPRWQGNDCSGASVRRRADSEEFGMLRRHCACA